MGKEWSEFTGKEWSAFLDKEWSVYGEVAAVYHRTILQRVERQRLPHCTLRQKTGGTAFSSNSYSSSSSCECLTFIVLAILESMLNS